MNRILISIFLGFTLAFISPVFAKNKESSYGASIQLKAPQSKPAGYADIHAQQALGRVLVTPDSRYLVFEWGKPYLNWVPDSHWMAPNVARRLETILYIFDTTEKEPVSKHLFFPNAGATYWLADLSPDSRRVSFFEIDHDDHKVRAGVWDIQEKKFTWFALRPDESRFGDVTPWLSEREFMYPIGDGAFARANAESGDAQPCPDCTIDLIRKAGKAAAAATARGKELATKIDSSDVPKDAKLLTGSANGRIGVYERNTGDHLSLMFTQNDYPVWMIFDNPRQWPRPKAATKAGEQAVSAVTSPPLPLPGRQGAVKKGGKVLRPWSVRDSIETKYISISPSAPMKWPGKSTSTDRVVTPSPDGKYFFFLTHRGEIESDAVMVELNVYSVDAVKSWLTSVRGDEVQAPEPFRHAILRSIRRVQWQETSDAILFLGTTERDGVQAQRFDIHTGLIEQLTWHAKGISSFSKRGDGMMFEDETSVPFETSYPVTVPSRGATLELKRAKSETMTTVYASYGGAKPKAVVAASRSGLARDVVYRQDWISPNGRYAIGWSQYVDPLSSSERVTATQLKEWPQFAIMDLKRSEERSILRAKAFWFGVRSAGVTVSPAPFWSSDSRRVVLVGTDVPSGSQRSRSDRVGGADPDLFIVDYELSSGRWKILEPMSDRALLESSRVPPRSYVSGVAWLEEGKELLVTHHKDGKPGDGTIYSFQNQGVVSRTVDATVTIPGLDKSTHSGLSFRLKQSANDPPRILVSDTEHEVSMANLKSELENLVIARTEDFEWQEANGRNVTGGLTLPVNSSRGKRIPLVVQPYYYLPQYFLPDGHTKTPSDAKQALAARGIAVLEFNIVEDSGTISPDFFVERLDAAVGRLVSLGIVDPDRIGVSGFSRGGHMVYYAITHPSDVRIAAAICADSWTADYSDYLIGGAFGGTWYAGMGESEEINADGKSFWSDKANWLKRETSFNVDKVRGATLFTSNGGGEDNYFDKIRTVGAFLLNKKPVEYLYFPEGGHQLEQPRERLAMSGIL